MKVQAIIPTAGSGVRMQSDTPKALLLLKEKTVIIRTLTAFEKASNIDSIILVVPGAMKDDYAQAVKQADLKKIKHYVSGGATRRESVFNGLQQLDEDTDIVVIHDGVRPLIDEALIKETIEACMEHAAVITAVEVKPTVKQIDAENLVVEKTLERRKLWEVQTPQVFKKDVILRAHQENTESNPTDDAFLVEKLDIPVKVVRGDYRNIKITTVEDLRVAASFLEGE